MTFFRSSIWRRLVRLCAPLIQEGCVVAVGDGSRWTSAGLGSSPFGMLSPFGGGSFPLLLVDSAFPEISRKPLRQGSLVKGCASGLVAGTGGGSKCAAQFADVLLTGEQRALRFVYGHELIALSALIGRLASALARRTGQRGLLEAEVKALLGAAI